MNNTSTEQINLNKKILKKIKILSINVNSVIKNQRRASLLNIINQQNPDIILINETKLNKNHIFKLVNYNIIRNDRNEEHPGGGTAIIIRKTIKFEEVKIPEINKGKALEHTIIKLDIAKSETLFIIAAYSRCGYKKEFIPDLNNLFTKLNLHKAENYYIIAGDLNAKHTDWKNSNNNTRGTVLKNWLTNNSMTYKTRLLCTKYSSYPNGNSFLDLVLADARLNFHNINDDYSLENIPYDSDHNAVKFHISLSEENGLELEPNNISYKYNFKKTNWKKFSRTLNELATCDIPNNRNLTVQKIKDHLQLIDENLIKAIDLAVPKIKDRNTVNAYINDKIKKLQKQKNKILTKIHHHQRKWPATNGTGNGKPKKRTKRS